MLALIAHRSVIDERTKMAVGLSRYDQLFFLAMFTIVVQVVILAVVRELDFSVLSDQPGDQVAGPESTGSRRGERSTNYDPISQLQMRAMVMEYVVLLFFILVDAMPMVLHLFSSRAASRTTTFQVENKLLFADYIMNPSHEEEDDDEDPTLLSSVYLDHVVECRRLHAKGVIVELKGVEHRLEVDVKSYLSLLIKARDSNNSPHDILRSRLVIETLSAEDEAEVRASTIFGYELRHVVVKTDLQDFSEAYSVGGSSRMKRAAASAHRPAKVIFNLRFQSMENTDLWLELQLIDASMPELQHLAYKLVTYEEGIKEISLLSRAAAVAYSLRVHVAHCALSCKVLSSEWYAFSMYKRSKTAKMKKKARLTQPSAVYMA